MAVVSTFALTLYRDYRCAKSGACCTSGWAIPVEVETTLALSRELAQRRLLVQDRLGQVVAPAQLLPRPAALPAEFGAVLGIDDRGACMFFEGDGERSCRIHRQLGHAMLPLACRQFPRLVLRDPRGVFVGMSHFCPTALGCLLASDDAVSVGRNLRAFPPEGEYVGLDATDGIPPLLRPDALMTLGSVTRWERFAVSMLASPGSAPDGALGSISLAAEQIRTWTPAQGSFDQHVAAVTARMHPVASASPAAKLDFRQCLAWHATGRPPCRHRCASRSTTRA